MIKWPWLFLCPRQVVLFAHSLSAQVDMDDSDDRNDIKDRCFSRFKCFRRVGIRFMRFCNLSSSFRRGIREKSLIKAPKAFQTGYFKPGLSECLRFEMLFADLV